MSDEEDMVRLMISDQSGSSPHGAPTRDDSNTAVSEEIAMVEDAPHASGPTGQLVLDDSTITTDAQGVVTRSTDDTNPPNTASNDLPECEVSTSQGQKRVSTKTDAEEISGSPRTKRVKQDRATCVHSRATQCTEDGPIGSPLELEPGSSFNAELVAYGSASGHLYFTTQIDGRDYYGLLTRGAPPPQIGSKKRGAQMNGGASTPTPSELNGSSLGTMTPQKKASLAGFSNSGKRQAGSSRNSVRTEDDDVERKPSVAASRHHELVECGVAGPLWECPASSCGHKFDDQTLLKFHQAHRHDSKQVLFEHAYTQTTPVRKKEASTDVEGLVLEPKAKERLPPSLVKEEVAQDGVVSAQNTPPKLEVEKSVLVKASPRPSISTGTPKPAAQAGIPSAVHQQMMLANAANVIHQQKMMEMLAAASTSAAGVAQQQQQTIRQPQAMSSSGPTTSTAHSPATAAASINAQQAAFVQMMLAAQSRQPGFSPDLAALMMMQQATAASSSSANLAHPYFGPK